MQLFSKQFGLPKNPTVVFLHGFLGHSTDWDDIVKPLQTDFHCVLIDLPGHGKSTHIESDIDDAFKQWHQLISECLDCLNVDEFHLVGYSLGGRVALDYARTQTTRRILSLVLESSHIGLKDIKAKKNRFENDLSWASKFKVEPMGEVLFQWYRQPVFQDLSDVKKRGLISEKIHNVGINVANALLATSLSKQEYAFDFLEGTALPILYLYGENDIKFKTLSKLFEKIKNIKVHSFSGVGHNIHHEKPLQYTQLIHNFITTESK